MLQDDINAVFGIGPYARRLYQPPPIEPAPFRRLEMYDRIASIHESAHVCYNYFRGEPVHSVEINKQGVGGGEFKPLPTSRVELSSDGSDPQQRANEDAPILKAIADPTTCVQWIAHLPAYAVARCAQHRYGAKQQMFDDACAHDDEIISRVIGLATPDAMARRELRELVECEAEEFVRRHWRDIERLADELFKRGFLNRAEIECVLAKRSEPEFRRRQDGYLRLK
jgi:hypothetical protein